MVVPFRYLAMPCKTTPILHLSSLSCSTHHCWLEPVVPFSHSKRHLVLPKVPISTKCRTKVAGNVPFTGVCKPLSELSFGFVDVCTGFGGADLATSELFELVVLMQRTSSREEPVNYCPLPLFLSCGIRSEYACRFRPTSSSYSTPSSSYQGANKLRDKIIKTIEKRIADYTFIPADHGEGLQVLYYEEGQKHDPHYDYFVDEFNTKNGGQRMATMLMSDVEEGGETVFPTANMKGEVDVRSESKKSISDTDDNIEDVMSFREDPVKLLEKAFVVYDSEEETKHNAKTNTTTEVKDEESLMDGSDRADTGHVDNMAHSVEEPIIRKAILKGPISVRTRQ
ncbi:hypothetical protein HID58_064626, partial [Brassica napus]